MVPRYTFVRHAKQDVATSYTEPAILDPRYRVQPFSRPSASAEVCESSMDQELIGTDDRTTSVLPASQPDHSYIEIGRAHV